jgi:hypothetical protein
MTAPTPAKRVDPARAIAEAVLYEGYLLWPYRRSAIKNRQRFTFGGVYPAAYAEAASERSAIRMECVLRAGGSAEVELALRCLQLVERRPARRVGDRWEEVDELVVGDERSLAFEEATEREISTGRCRLERLTGRLSIEVNLPAGEEVELLGVEAAIVRRWHLLSGLLELSAERCAPDAFTIRASLRNESAGPGSERSEALARAFLSAHFVAAVDSGELISMVDPPPELARQVRRCQNDGVWPVLVGEPGTSHMMLGSPIILEDHPQVAPESPGALFDGTEIDLLLIHSIRGLTDAERDEIRATDPRAREILDRSLTLPPEAIARLQGGAFRHVQGAQP